MGFSKLQVWNLAGRMGLGKGQSSAVMDRVTEPIGEARQADGYSDAMAGVTSDGDMPSQRAQWSFWSLWYPLLGRVASSSDHKDPGFLLSTSPAAYWFNDGPWDLGSRGLLRLIFRTLTSSGFLQAYVLFWFLACWFICFLQE